MKERGNVQTLDSHDALIAHCREIMGPLGEGLSDEEIDRLRRHAEDMARVLIEIFRATTPRADGA